MHKVELTFTEKIPLSLNLFAKKKKEKGKNPKPEELINELTISPKTKSFHIRFFQDRKKILDLQLNPFTKLYHREKIPHSSIDIPCYIETHTHTQPTKFQILSGVSAEFHYHANSIDRYPRNKRGNIPPVLVVERLLRATAIFIHLPDPTRLVQRP